MVSNVSSLSVFSQFNPPENFNKDGYYFAVQSNEEKEKQEKHYGKAVAFSSIAVGAATLAATFLLKRGGKEKFASLLRELGARGESISTNAINIRDAVVKKIMFITKPTKAIHEGITHLWDKIGQGTLKRIHLKTTNKFTNFCSYMNSVNAGVKSRAATDLSQGLLEQINRDVVSKLSGTEFTNRIKSMHSSMDILDKFHEVPLKSLFNKEELKGMLKTAKTNTIIAAARNQANDITKPMQECYEKLTKELLPEYKKVLSQKDYAKLERKVNYVVKSFDKSLKLETVNYFDMLRDLKVGSAPTDVTAILSTSATAVWALSWCKDDETRKSAALKYGIPVIGAVSMQPITTAMLMAGFKSAAAGIVTGFLFNRIGEQVDNARKKYEPKLAEITNTVNKNSVV